MNQDNDVYWNERPTIRKSKEEAISELVAFSRSQGSNKLSVTRFRKWTRKTMSSETIVGLFGSWPAACEAAGLESILRYNSDYELLIYLDKVWRWKGHKIVSSDIRAYNRIHGTTVSISCFYRRWGSFSKFVELFQMYMQNRVSLAHVIQQKDQHKTRSAICAKTRSLVFERNNYTCQYCGRTPSDGVKLHVDHIHPVSQGGSNDLENLATSCQECNLGKGNRILAA